MTITSAITFELDTEAGARAGLVTVHDVALLHDPPAIVAAFAGPAVVPAGVCGTKFTVVVPPVCVKFVPVRTTVVLPVCGPFVGSSAVTVGGGT